MNRDLFFLFFLHVLCLYAGSPLAYDRPSSLYILDLAWGLMPLDSFFLFFSFLRYLAVVYIIRNILVFFLPEFDFF